MTEVIAEKNRQDIFISRTFNASKQLVFQLFTDKELNLKWQSAILNGFKFVKFEPKIGGQYHHIHQATDGLTYGFKGIYHDLILNEKIIKTSEFLGLPFTVLPTLEIISFEEIEKETKLCIQIICDSEATRNAMVQHGMKQHFEAVFSAMDELLQN